MDREQASLMVIGVFGAAATVEQLFTMVEDFKTIRPL